jgi:hypothetical protein
MILEHCILFCALLDLGCLICHSLHLSYICHAHCILHPMPVRGVSNNLCPRMHVRSLLEEFAEPGGNWYRYGDAGWMKIAMVGQGSGKKAAKKAAKKK